jgi:hypothetical protein
MAQLNDWKQWAKEQPSWIGGIVEDAFWNFEDQKWGDSLKIATAKPAILDHGADFRRTVDTPRNG